MLKPALFDELTRLGACADAVSFLKSQQDPVVALAKLPPEYRDWLARALGLPARKACDEAIVLARKTAAALACKAYEEAYALACKAYEEATAPACKAYEEAVPGEIMSWYEGLPG